ncbi:urea ABC transporter permease subunit UrtB [Robbsia sp. Bb-Pol-6]|uniref:Urea ABC transporter permease subunit UrtB n=1 Tax=Robbsia betulipollinis TaxID=2981849 RepID=A0ABT3ZHV0_9BURK|nr:urea ABC transporter permease subunit UrtB [Robbsia betulipollinis]MCY0386002.1 urea ABC transporter permease subunit UrtB [Robbsia betulipollinis]
MKSPLFLPILLLSAVLLCGGTRAAQALTRADLAPLASDDFDAKAQAIQTIAAQAATGDTAAARLLQALADDTVSVASTGTSAGVVLIAHGDTYHDALNDRPVAADVAAQAQPLTLSNVLRRQVAAAASANGIDSPDKTVRGAAIDALLRSPDPAAAPRIDTALAREKDPALRARLETLWALTALHDADPARRLKAVGLITATGRISSLELLRPLTLRDASGVYADTDPRVRAAAAQGIQALAAIQRRNEIVGTLFAGLSLGSVLLLAALGLAITYGLIGVINMAHGEFLMIGAYATWIVQNLFRQHLPGAFDWYPLAAIPAAFLAAALVGIVIERLIIRHLYGRPLETLLTTFGVSLLLIQATRMLFGAQNVQVENPSWMSGGIAVLPGLTLPYNRLSILAFSVAVIVLAWGVLNRTRLGLFIRAVTQNRRMAACVGVRTGRVDSYAFAFGAGIAGLGGCALAQIGNVGPDLGQSYIIDSFMSVVLGGVGQLAGTVIGAFGLGVISKAIEPFWGAVLAKIVVLLLVVLFIQKRPQGLFALKGRSAEH